MYTVGKSTRYYSGFNPTSIPGCMLWLDGADSNMFTYSSGSNVSTWISKISNTTFTQSGTAGRLTRIAYQGYPTVFFDSDGTTNAFMSGSLSLPAAFTVVQVLTPLAYSGGTWSFIWSWAYGSSGNRVPGFRSSNASPNFEPYITWFGNNANSLAVTQGTRYVTFVEVTNSGANTSYSISGNTPTSGTLTANTFTPTTFLLGGDGPSAASVFGRFYLSEILMFSNQLTTPQRQQLEGYLGSKWGLTASLPAAHPFKSIPPFLRSFSPLNISGSALWLDGADRGSLTFSGSSVSAWADKSGNGYTMTQATSANMPTNTLVNGRYYMDFSKASSNFLSNVSMNIDYRNSTIFIMFQRKTAAINEGLFTPVTQFSPSDWNATNQFVITNRVEVASAGSGTDDGQMANLNPTNYAFIINNNSLTTFRDFGTSSVISRNMGLTAIPPRLYVGIRADALLNYPADVYIGEILVYSRVLSTPEYQTIQGYLADKWGLRANLPSTHPLKLTRPLSVPFNPVQLSGCALWFDAADRSTLTLTGTNITQWRDKSGNGCNATGVNNPTYSNNTVNFLRSSSQYFTLGNGALPSGNSAYSYFVLCKFTNAAAASGLIGGGSFGASRQVFAFRNMNGEIANNLLTYWWGADLVSPSNRYTLNTDIIAGSFYAPGVTSGRTMFVNGTQIASDTPGTRSQTISNNRIGTTNFTEYMSGSISEIIVYSNALSVTDRQQVEGYLAWKWGLRTSVPTTHPYYKFNPA